MRGKILKDTTFGDGVISVDGEQPHFSLAAHWKSERPPVTGAVVEVQLNEKKEIIAVTLVDESQLLKEQAKKIADFALSHIRPAALLLHKRVGTVTLALTAIIFISWTMLATLGGHTFLNLLNSNGGSGVYFFLMLGALLSPILSHFYDHKYSSLGYCAPFVFMIVMGISISLDMSSYLSYMSLGAGFYCAVAATTYLAFLGIRKYSDNMSDESLSMNKNIKKLSSKDFRAIYFTLLFFWFSLGVIPSIALGIYVGVMMDVQSVAGAYFIAALVLFVLLAFPYWMARRKRNKINLAYQKAFLSVQGIINKIDYCHTSYLGGTIAVDVAAKKIGITTLDTNDMSIGFLDLHAIKIKDSFGVCADRLLSYKAFDPGVTTFETIGNVGAAGLVNSVDNANRNMQARSNAARKTGLYLDLDDVSRPQVFVPMNYSDAEKWHLILKKLMDGSLEQQPNIMLYPPLN